jgi:membrane-bound lytic murein transglycosylase F
VTAYPDRVAMLTALREGHADLIAAHLSFDPSWGKDLQGAKPCYEMPQVFVAVRGRAKPRALKDLAGLKLLVPVNSPQQRRAEALRAQIAGLTVMPVTNTPGSEWSDRLLAGDGDVALVDAAELALTRNTRVRLYDAFSDPVSRPVQWIIRKNAQALAAAIDVLCEDLGGPDLLARAMQRTLPMGRRARRVPAAEFRMLQTTRLPQLVPYFQEAATTSALDWRLLAALGYQESQWDPTAVSPNGARGLMMLMPATARSLAVSDLFEARDSIMGGARYLAEQKAKLPERIREPDRSLFALAVYNIGMGHLEDARILTQQNGANPDSWADVKRHLPLLEQEYWYSRAENGYARGGETIGLVENVRQYWNLLADYQPPPAPTLEDSDAAPAVDARPEPVLPATEPPATEPR